MVTLLALPPETFTASLLHDIGKLILKQLIDPDKLDKILELSDSNGKTYIEAEKEVLGYSHTDVGFRIAKLWNFSDSIAESILYHHNPEKHHKVITDAVHVSNICAKMIGLGLGNEALNLFGSGDSAARLGITPKDFEKVCFAVSEKLPDIEKLYN